MNEKLETLVKRIDFWFCDTKLTDKQREELAQAIQQYADEQALGFAKWLYDDKWRKVEVNMWSKGFGNYRGDQLLTRYHESQKP